MNVDYDIGGELEELKRQRNYARRAFRITALALVFSVCTAAYGFVQVVRLRESGRLDLTLRPAPVVERACAEDAGPYICLSNGRAYVWRAP